VWTYRLARNICCAGTLHVVTAHARTYMMMINLIALSAGSSGAKNRPSQIMPARMHLHPRHRPLTLIVDDVQDILGYLELAILRLQ
jgi:hypothetical protein